MKRSSANSGIIISGDQNKIGAAAAGYKAQAVSNVSGEINGFETEENRTQFVSEIEILRSTLQTLMVQLTTAAKLAENEREDLEAEMLNWLRELRQVKETATTLPLRVPIPDRVLGDVKATLNKTAGVLESFAVVADKASELSNKFGPVVRGAWLLIGSMRHLIGIP